LVQSRVSVVIPPTAGYQGCPGLIGPSEPARVIPVTPEGDVSWQAVAPEEVQVKFHDSPLKIVTRVSEPLILISAVTAPGGGGGGGATSPITTESVALVTPLVQSMVRVVEAVRVGYQE